MRREIGSKTGSKKDYLKQTCDGRDPLSQTFLISERGGCFLTKLDFVFCQKITHYQFG